MKNGEHVFAFVGGVIGLVLFMFIGLLPSLVYGGFAGVVLANSIITGSIAGSILAKGLVIFGMISGLLATAGLFVITSSMISLAIFNVAGKFSKIPAQIRSQNEEG